MKRVVFVITLLALVFFLCRHLNPISNEMFTFHDETQPARIQQFVLNLKKLQIPPRQAPDFSFNLSYPVFNFYAPTSYWITGIINLLGVDVINSLKLSFALSLMLAFIFSFLFFKNYFDFYPSLLGSVLYASNLYFAVDIFVRGNLAEIWFLALAPLAFHLVYKNSQRSKPIIFFATAIVLSAVFTTHNLLSLVFIPIIVVYIFLLKNKGVNLLAFVLALVLGSYFLLPLIFESSLTYAQEVARLTNYQDHFLCPNQLWQSAWGYGGSATGCLNDGMSFKIGKIQLIFFFLAILLFLKQVTFKKETKINKELLFFLVVTMSSLFLTTYQSKFIWAGFTPLFSIFQFPWRFISFSLIGIGFFATYLFSKLRIPFKNLILVIIIFFTLIINGKYFYKSPILKQDFKNTYLTQDYIEQKVAYKVAEYLPKSASYDYWLKFKKTFDYRLPVELSNSQSLQIVKNDPFAKTVTVNVTAPSEVKINIHYFPYWKIYINGKQTSLNKFDQLGRPLIYLSQSSTIKIVYEQTLIEKVGNLATIIAFLFLLMLVLYKPIWKRSKIPNI